MSLKSLPDINALNAPQGIDGSPPIEALERWDGGVRSAAPLNGNAIDIFGIVGAPEASGDGIADKDVMARLRSISGPVTVNINSPGGSYQHGVAIYSMLKQYQGAVNVKVLGQAGSAASVIAMAGDDIAIAAAGMIMIHNAEVLANGNRHLLAQAAGWLAAIDKEMAAVYAARSGRPVTEIEAMMDRTTFMMGSEAVAKGFATGIMANSELRDDRKARAHADHIIALQTIEMALAAAGKSRSTRRDLIGKLRGTPSAAANATPSAGLADVASDLRRFLSGL